MTSGSPSAIFVAPCEGRGGEWLPRRLLGKRLRDLFHIISGGKLCYKLLPSRSRFYFIWDLSRIMYEDPEPNYYFVNNNIYFNNVRVLSESNMRFIIRIITVLLRIILLF